MKRNNIIKKIVLFLALSGISMAASHIKDVEAVTEVFGDGEKLSAVILTYDKALKGSSVSADDYEIPERTIKRVYVNTKKEKSKSRVKNGKYVVIELTDLPMNTQMGEPKRESSEEKAKKEAKGITGPVLGSSGSNEPLETITAKVTQKGKVTAVNGKIYSAEDEIASSHTRQLVVEDFIQDTFVDSDGGKLMYNLYIPKNYDPKKTYPLVVFMHDAGAVSSQVKKTLVQGRGAIAWANPGWQKKHPAFVLAPQYDKVTVNDKYEYGPELDRTINLIKDLSKKYSINAKRIYNTGQSMGGMSSISMDSRYPDFFAASYIVASKWDVKVTDPMANQNIWFVASEGDPGAYPSINEITENLSSKGAVTQKMTMDAAQPEQTSVKQLKEAINPKYNIYYTIYKGGNHRYTWQYAYNKSMEPAMEWIFSKSR